MVTGFDVAVPNGLRVAAWWATVLRGESGIRPLTRFGTSGYPARLADEVPGFVAEEALKDAGADPAELPEHAAGAVTGESAGGFEFGRRALRALWSKGSRRIGTYQAFA
ncbi:hypothetical protein [Streptomyces sp. NWU339]|uniref:hypothetical protein n=1 Tax=Streptomyces sp. NWU339 TaxID=2185284 RepID=UPI00215A4CC9|nr:hypothetical protein [Streptomyces sp. NWU339]